MKHEDLVDVVIPTRNRVSLTLEAIKSVELQTHPNWHIYVVDDKSDDGSADRLVELLREKPRVSVVGLTTNVGESGARDAGYRAGNGAFIATLDSDDVWLPTKLEKQVARFRETSELLPDVGGVLCGHCWTDEQLASPWPPKFPLAYSRSPLVSNNMSTLFVTREALTRAGGFRFDAKRRYPQAENLENYVRFSQHFSFVSVQELLVLCRTHQAARESDTIGSHEGAESLDRLITDYAGHLALFPDELAALRARLGARYLATGSLGRGMQEMLHAFRAASPTKRLELVRSYAPSMVKSTLRSLRKSAST